MNLFLTIGLTVILFLLFKLFPKYGINTFNAVVFNYVTCVIAGSFFAGFANSFQEFTFSSPWVLLSLLTGSLFIFTFYLIGITVSKVSMAVATIANKMSLVIPVLAHYLLFQTSQVPGLVKSIGLLTGLAAILLTSYQKAPEGIKLKNRFLFLLPILVFLLGGIIDTLINYANQSHLPPGKEAHYSLFAFLTAAVLGCILMLVRLVGGHVPKLKDLAGGILLGIPNYFSIYFLLKTLTDFGNDGSVVFPVLNISIITISAVASLVIFREKLNRYNLAGLLLAIVSIILVFLTENQR